MHPWYPKEPSEAEIRAKLFVKLKKFGWHPRLEVPISSRVMDIAVFSADREIMLAAIEVKRSSLESFKAAWLLGKCPVQFRRYQRLLGDTPLIVCFGMTDFERVTRKLARITEPMLNEQQRHFLKLQLDREWPAT
jgi:hypothetical protein